MDSRETPALSETKFDNKANLSESICLLEIRVSSLGNSGLQCRVSLYALLSSQPAQYYHAQLQSLSPIELVGESSREYELGVSSFYRVFDSSHGAQLNAVGIEMSWRVLSSGLTTRFYQAHWYITQIVPAVTRLFAVSHELIDDDRCRCR